MVFFTPKIPLFLFKRYYRDLGLRVTLYALLAFLVALISPFARSYLGGSFTSMIGIQAVMPVLTILASSMLAVSTFSLNVMVSAHRAAADAATPRVHRLLLEDTTTQSVLAAFIGAFVYALTSIVLLQSGFYADEAAFVIMAITVLVVLIVVTTMLRWIKHLSVLGSLDDSLDKVAEHARSGLMRLSRNPAYGANPLTEETVLPYDVRPVHAPASGYIQLINISALQNALPEGAGIYVLKGPGEHVLKGERVAQVSGAVSEEDLDFMASCLVIHEERSYEQDPVFGLLVLSEISSHALSPGINDPGTAIQAIVRLKTLLWDYTLAEDQEHPPVCPNVFVPVPSAFDLCNTAFAATARDGAGTIEVSLALRQALHSLSVSPDEDMRKAARRMAELAHDHVEAGPMLKAEKARLHAIRFESD